MSRIIAQGGGCFVWSFRINHSGFWPVHVFVKQLVFLRGKTEANFYGEGNGIKDGETGMCSEGVPEAVAGSHAVPSV